MSFLSVVRANIEFLASRALMNYGKRLVLLEELDKSVRPVFVYQMGKVGSASILKSLNSQHSEPLLHGHGFAPDFHNWPIRYLHQVFKEGKPLDVVTLTREPVSRNVSHFFQKIEEYSGRHPKEFNTKSTDELLRLFLETYEHDLATDWFDNHIKKNFGIDVYGKEIPDRGYQFYEKGRVRVLLIKLEVSDSVKEDAVKKFLNKDVFTLTSSNISINKSYGDLYQSFIKNVLLPEEYIESILSSKYFKHFYDDQTATAVWEKWHRKQ